MKLVQIIFLIFLSISVAQSAGSDSSSSDGNTSSSNYNGNLSKIVIKIGNESFSEALIDLEKYVYENPNDPDGWNYIGLVSRKLKNFNDAERYYAVGLEINPNHVGILEYQGELYIETNRLETVSYTHLTLPTIYSV